MPSQGLKWEELGSCGAGEESGVTTRPPAPNQLLPAPFAGDEQDPLARGTWPASPGVTTRQATPGEGTGWEGWDPHPSTKNPQTEAGGGDEAKPSLNNHL